MIVYKKQDVFDTKTGKFLRQDFVEDHVICDFCGTKLSEYSHHLSYSVDYRDHDPCFGDGIEEDFIYKMKLHCDEYELLGQQSYHFYTNDSGISLFEKLLEAANHSKIEIYDLDTLLRWSRAKMLQRVIENNIYTLEELIGHEIRTKTDEDDDELK